MGQNLKRGHRNRRGPASVVYCCHRAGPAHRTAPLSVMAYLRRKAHPCQYCDLCCGCVGTAYLGVDAMGSAFEVSMVNAKRVNALLPTYLQLLTSLCLLLMVLLPVYGIGTYIYLMFVISLLVF